MDYSRIQDSIVALSFILIAPLCGLKILHRIRLSDPTFCAKQQYLPVASGQQI